MTIVPIRQEESAYPVLWHEHGLEFTADMDFEQWTDLGETLLRMTKCSHAWLGDWWRFGERSYGEAAAQAAPTGYAAKTLQNDAWIAERIEPERRHPELSWSHHEAVAALEPDVQDELLDKAETEGLTVAQIRAAARQHRPSRRREEVEPTYVDDFREMVKRLADAVKAGDRKAERGVLGEIAQVARRKIAELGGT